MACRRNDINPITQLFRTCACTGCRERRRIAHQLEWVLAAIIGLAVAAGQRPTEIAERARSATTHQATVLEVVRTEIVCLAGAWLSKPECVTLLDEADHLAEQAGVDVGLTIPGWLGEWIDRRSDSDAAIAERVIREAVRVIDPLDRPNLLIDPERWYEVRRRLAMIPTEHDLGRGF